MLLAVRALALWENLARLTRTLEINFKDTRPTLVIPSFRTGEVVCCNRCSSGVEQILIAETIKLIVPPELIPRWIQSDAKLMPK